MSTSVELTAEHVARALVAACRETSEDPVLVASREPGAFRSRHYAMWALLQVFPDLSPKAAAQFVGCPGQPMAFYHNSRYQAAPGRPGGGKWWNAGTYERVIAAIDSHAPPLPPEPPPFKAGPLPPARKMVKPISEQERRAARLGTLDENGGYRPPPGTASHVLEDDRDDRPVFDRGRIGVGAMKPRDHHAQSPVSKQTLRDQLRDAVANTAKMAREN